MDPAESEDGPLRSWEEGSSRRVLGTNTYGPRLPLVAFERLTGRSNPPSVLRARRDDPDHHAPAKGVENASVHPAAGDQHRWIDAEAAQRSLPNRL